MAEQPGAGRLDPETLAAYVDGLLPPEERARVEAEIAADPEDYEWLVGTINAVDDGSIAGARAPSVEPGPSSGSDVPAHVLPFYRRRAAMGSVGVLFAAAASALLVIQLQPQWWQQLRGPQADPRVAILVEAVGEERIVEARLTGGFKYGPLRQVMRGPDDVSSQNARLLAAAGELQQQAEQNPTADTLHAWGMAQLLVGRLDESVTTLRAAFAKDAKASIASDLAAALLAHGRFRGDRRSAEDALAMLDGLEFPEALYNRALALSALGRDDEARRAWQAAARAEPGGGWVDEAVARASGR